MKGKFHSAHKKVQGQKNVEKLTEIFVFFPLRGEDTRIILI